MRHVLLVEDDEDDVLIVTDELAHSPEFKLTPVPTLRAALDVLSVDPVQCVLLDLNLPDSAGFDGLQRLLAHPSSPAVVVLTGDTDTERGPAAVAAGAQDYLIKGRNEPEALMRAIRYAIERRSTARWRQEVAVARVREAENDRLQRGLLPAPILNDDTFSVSTAYQPGSSQQLLGGDFYDIVQTPDGTLHAMIGDVCGHGPDEAALGVRLRMAWRTLVLSQTPAPTVFATLDRVLEHEREDPALFITAAQVSITPDGSAATLQLAGHPPPVLLDNDGASLVGACSGPALGLLDETPTWPSMTLALHHPWTLLLYTDGLFEGRNRHRSRRLGLDGLLAVFRDQTEAMLSVDPPRLQDLVADVTERNGKALDDDVALISIRHRRGGR